MKNDDNKGSQAVSEVLITSRVKSRVNSNKKAPTGEVEALVSVDADSGAIGVCNDEYTKFPR